MANLDAPNGFKPIGTMSGSPYNANIQNMECDASAGAIFIGDLVALEADGKVIPMTATGIPYGVCVGVDESMPIGVNGVRDNAMSTGALNFQGHSSASTANVIQVLVGPDVLYEVQEDAGGGALAITDIGINAAVLATAGSTTTGRSAMELDSSTAATTATLPLKIVDFVQRPDNEIGSVGARWIVRLNDTHFTAAVAGI